LKLLGKSQDTGLNSRVDIIAPWTSEAP